MEYRRCGSSGILLPEISLGLWHNFGDVDSFDESRRMICLLLKMESVILTLQIITDLRPEQPK